MSNHSSKPISDRSGEQVLQAALNNDDKSIAISSYATSKIGAKVHITNVQPSPAIDDIRYLDIVRTDTATTVSTSPILTGLTDSIEFLSVGQYVFGTGIPENAKIISVDSETQVTMDMNATASGTVPLKFANLLIRLRLQYDDSSRTNLIDSERLD